MVYLFTGYTCNIFQHEEVLGNMQEKSNYQWVSEEFIFGIVLPEEESAVAVHSGLDLNHQLVVF